jgi:hypothetical protein
MFICKNLYIEAKRSKLMLNCESSEAKRTCQIVEKIISKRSEHVYIEEFEYRSEANRFASDFVFKKRKKTFFFFLNEGQKTKGFDSIEVLPFLIMIIELCVGNMSVRPDSYKLY